MTVYDRFPFSCLDCSIPEGNENHRILFAASGPKIFSINLEKKSNIQVWPQADNQAKRADQENDDHGEPPGKKRKLSPPPGSPNILKLTLSHNRKHLVAVSSEDKCIRVFSVSEQGSLDQLSQRCMPKRPSAIALTWDDDTIFCGDKFGDVYALPLLPPSGEPIGTPLPDDMEASQEEQKELFIPSATNLTVHTARNRRALENQAKIKKPVKTKEPLKFSHQLLLGHVSMLTDLTLVTLSDENMGSKRNYILTADRDEHIRVSRGVPQAHIIEGFCLGHKEFVSRICLPRPEILVSGGGDDFLAVWDWVNRGLKNKINIHGAVGEFPKNVRPTGKGDPPVREPEERKIAVSGLWAYPQGPGESLLVTCEEVPALFHLAIADLESPDPVLRSIPLNGNPLDVVVAGNSVIVSIDTSVKSSCTGEEMERISRLQSFVIKSDKSWNRIDELNEILYEADKEINTVGDVGSMHDILYGIENLRKRGGESDT
ncbi:hypothetical protein M501DRAFT_959805 [Patellaria atrata CBS 101060]|uniref:Transfer RNA methyltransferase 82 n=1 Tax=Patellaria atrata CBS 101060 TaxID=1346257 RepID=A0A9P4VP78_9PEZI|nr:hypothetical protein M501DRAFT_959805 [Patellaria atrata CBS 101060]